MSNKLYNRQETKEIRSALRKNLTPAEATLWRILKSSSLGAKFRRQHSVGPYIIDFYCPRHKLGIELDGAYHFTEEGMRYDEQRDIFLNRFGIKIIRIENKLVFERTDSVISTIEESLKQ